MLKDKKIIIKSFLEHHFNTQKTHYLKREISHFIELVKLGILYENNKNTDVLEISKNSTYLQSCLLEIAEDKLKKKLPINISEAFKFINEFDDFIKKEYQAKAHNIYDHIIEGLESHILFILYQKKLDIKGFLFSLNTQDKREHHLFSFESAFFNFLPLSDYSENEIFEILIKVWEDKYKRYDITTSLRELPIKNINKSKQLLIYASENNMPLHFIAELLIGLYNTGEPSAIEKIIKLNDKNRITCLSTLSIITYKNKQDVQKAFNQIEDLDFENIEIASQQSYLIHNIIKNEYSTNSIRKDSFKLYISFLKEGTNEIKDLVIQDISFINGYEADKYNLLYLYLSKTENFKIIKEFFNYFKNPAYIFDIIMRLFNNNPTYRFSTKLFENGIRHGWTINQQETEENILNLFKQHPAFGILGIKVMLIAYIGIQIDLLKLDKAEYQINAISNICKFPHSFDKLLPLILPLRNSKLKGVRLHLQKHLAKKVFSSYHGIIYKQIENSIGKTKRDKEFLEPIEKAWEDYKKLKELKESISDLNPYENERHLMDFYYRLEHETKAKMIDEIKAGKGTFMETLKNVTIVRGNSWMIREGEVSPLGKYESSMLIDGSSYLNPDLYEHNLNIIE